MKCFIHSAKEAVAACKQCGKGMCSNCSAYSGHTGICPQCRKVEFEAERARLTGEEKDLRWAIFGWSVFTVVLAVTIIGLFFGGYKIISSVIGRKKANERINYLTREIAKLNNALRSGNAVI